MRFEQPAQSTPSAQPFTAPVTLIEPPPETKSRSIGRSILALWQHQTQAAVRAVKRYGAWLKRLELEL